MTDQIPEPKVESELFTAATIPETVEPVMEPAVEPTVTTETATTTEPSTEEVVVKKESESSEDSEVKPKRKPRVKKPKTPPVEEAAPAPEEPLPPMEWYILKVASNREESIREALRRRVTIGGLDSLFGESVVPIERITEVRGGKKRVSKRKLYPGYMMVQMVHTQETYLLVRETPGIGGFTGPDGYPTPMATHEVEEMLRRQGTQETETPKLSIPFAVGDMVRIREGMFENYEGEIQSIDQATGKVNVHLNIFGRSTPVEIKYWQIDKI